MYTHIKKILSLIRADFTIKSVPCFMNGAYSPITSTHFDDYHNIIILLNGSKTFYLAPQDSIINTPNKNENETDANPHDKVSTFLKTTLTSGDMFFIPKEWWPSHPQKAIQFVGEGRQAGWGGTCAVRRCGVERRGSQHCRWIVSAAAAAADRRALSSSACSSGSAELWPVTSGSKMMLFFFHICLV